MGKKWLDNKTVLRIISLIIAIALWSFVIITQDPERTARIDDVEVICGLSQTQLNEGLTIISKSHETVSFSATGKRSLVTGVYGTYYAKLNLDSINAPGKYSIVPTVSKPESVSINNVNPTAIDVYIDKYVSSLIPVKVHMTGLSPDGIVITGATADISLTSVTVPSLMLEEISYVGAVIDLSQISSSRRIDCVPVLYGEDGKILEITNASIEAAKISVDVTAESTKSVPVYPNIYDPSGFTAGLTMNSSPRTVDIYGSADAVNAVEALGTSTLSFFAAPAAGEEFYANILLPQGVRLAESATSTVTITYK